MGGLYDQDEPIAEEITADNCEGFDCPECGCNDVTIEVWPQRTSWFGGNGRGRCNHCGASGPLNLIEYDDEGNVIPLRPADVLKNGKWFG